MSNVVVSREGIRLRQAALVAAAAMLLGLGVPLAEFVARPRLIVPGDVAATMQSIGAHRALFVASMGAYFVAFTADIVVAWALQILLAPVNRALAMLMAWFRLVYAVIALGALMNLVTVSRVLAGPDADGGSEQLVEVLLDAFHGEWGLGMVLFGVHLGLLGCLTYRSGYVPRLLGVGLGIAGLGYLFYYLQPYLYPGLHLPFVVLTITGLGELAFLLWLITKGSRLRTPAEDVARTAG